MFSLALFLLTLAPTPARADCQNLRLFQFDGSHDFRQEANPSIELRVRASGDCSFFLTIDNGGASSHQRRVLRRSGGDGEAPVSICLDQACTRHWKDFPEAVSSADVLSGAVNTRDSDEVRLFYYPRLGSGEYAPFGSYENSFTVRLYQGTVNGARVLSDTESVRLRTQIEKRIDLSLVSTGLPFDSSATNKTLDFGLLSQGKVMGFDLLVKYNAGYRVRLSSLNGGVMRHRTLESTVPYTITLNGSPVTLGGPSTPVTVSQGSGASPAAGLRLPGRVEIGSISGSRAGSYEDLITVSVSTTE